MALKNLTKKGVLAYLLLATIFTGCASFRHKAKVDKAALPPYSGPKAKIAVADFEAKTVKASSEICLALREMLVGALLNSNRFLVVEHQALTADLIITAAVTEFEPSASGGSAGVGGGGGVGSGALGGLLGMALNKAHLALDIRIVNAATSKVLAATRVQGQASDISGTVTAGLWEKHGVGGALSVYANTPMEKAIRICIIEAVRYVSGGIPPKYYKY
jgi:curli biogenesis system outer membrane secretion channel CsgG